MPKPDALNGKVVLLTDGNSEAGRALALRLADAGADIAVLHADHDRHFAAVTRRLIIKRSGRRCVTVAGSPQDGASRRALVRHVVERLGRLDIYIDGRALMLGERRRRESGPIEPSNGQSGPAASTSHVTPFSGVDMLVAVMEHWVAPPDRP